MLHENIGINEKGHLAFAGCDTVELAGKYGTPLYLLDENRIRCNCRVYTSAMREFFGGDSGPLFASKAISRNLPYYERRGNAVRYCFTG